MPGHAIGSNDRHLRHARNHRRLAHPRGRLPHVRRLRRLPQIPPNSSTGNLKIVFGRDSRPSGTWVRDAAIAALVASGLEVVDLDIVTTPGVAMMVRHLNADAGVIATASHNPIEWNGLKFLNRDAVAPPAADAQIIKDYLR